MLSFNIYKRGTWNPEWYEIVVRFFGVELTIWKTMMHNGYYYHWSLYRKNKREFY